MISKAQGNIYYSIATMTLYSTISLTALDSNDAYGSMIPLVKCLNVDRFGALLTVSHCVKITHLQIGKRVFFKHGFRASNTSFFARHFVYPLAQRRAKNISMDCCKEQRVSNIKLFLYSPICDILWSHLQTDAIEL